MMPEATLAALKHLAVRLGVHVVPFMLGGSGMLAALGLTDEVGDLDLVCREQDHDRLKHAAGDWWVGSGNDSDQTGLWAGGWLARLKVEGVKVDAIGGMALRDGDRVVPVPFRSGGTWQAGGQDVALAAPELWWVIYRYYKPAKAALLETVVPVEARQQALEELGLDSAP